MREKITRKRLVLIGVAAAAVLAAAVPAAFAGTTYINGQLSPGDTQQTDRLFRDGVPSTCTYFFGNPDGTSKLDPGLLGDQALRSVDVYGFWNATNQAQCVTVRLRTTCGPFDPLGVNGFSASYFFYDPASPSELDINGDPLGNSIYAGDAGQSGTPMQYGFVVFPFETFEVVVSTVDIDLANCNNYLLTVQIGKTAKVIANVNGKLKPGSWDKKRH